MDESLQHTDPGIVAVGPFELIELDGVDVSGLSIESMRNGHARVRAKRVEVRSALARAGQTSFSIANAGLVNVLANFVRAAGNDALELLDLTADEVRVGLLQAVSRGVPQAGRPAALRLQALDDADGLLRAFITDALWFVDAEIVVPLANGVIDLARVEVEHIGPDSTLRMGPTGLQVKTPHGPGIDVLVFDERELSFRNGVLEVRSIVEGLVRSAPGKPAVRLANPDLAGPIRRTRLEGHVQLGEGSLGTAADHLVLSRRGEDRNRVEISSPALAESVVIRMPALAASSASFALPGRAVTTAGLSAGIEMQLVTRGDDGSDRRPAIELTVSDVCIASVNLEAADTSSGDAPGTSSGDAPIGLREAQSGKPAASG